MKRGKSRGMTRGKKDCGTIERMNMEWIALESAEQLSEIDKLSHSRPVVLFKHSTRCSVSAMALDRMERGGESLTGMSCYYLDLLAHRDVSQAIADRYGVEHESPQAIVVRNGRAVWHESHTAISPRAIRQVLELQS